jgi:hypothetical protein
LVLFIVGAGITKYHNLTLLKDFSLEHLFIVIFTISCASTVGDLARVHRRQWLLLAQEFRQRGQEVFQFLIPATQNGHN